jgi:hypothetical protein
MAAAVALLRIGHSMVKLTPYESSAARDTISLQARM